MYLGAVSVGYAVPPGDFDTVVHSVFHSAVNLKPEGDDKLLTLLAFTEMDLPQGIRLNTPREFSFEELPIGSPGSCRDGILELGDFLFRIDLRNARCWDRSLLSLCFDMTNPAVEFAWQCAWRVLNDRQEYSGADFAASDVFSEGSSKSALSRQISEALHNLIIETRQCRLNPKNTIRGLIGLGTGLTPIGDDVLVGYLAGLRCSLSGNKRRRDFLRELKEAVIRLSIKTNEISRTYLYHAAQGHVSSRLSDLARMICNGSSQYEIMMCTESAMQAGHSSGMDTVSGLLLGLAAWCDLTRIMSGKKPCSSR